MSEAETPEAIFTMLEGASGRVRARTATAGGRPARWARMTWERRDVANAGVAESVATGVIFVWRRRVGRAECVAPIRVASRPNRVAEDGARGGVPLSQGRSASSSFPDARFRSAGGFHLQSPGRQNASRDETTSHRPSIASPLRRFTADDLWPPKADLSLCGSRGLAFSARLRESAPRTRAGDHTTHARRSTDHHEHHVRRHGHPAVRCQRAPHRRPQGGPHRARSRQPHDRPRCCQQRRSPHRPPWCVRPSSRRPRPNRALLGISVNVSRSIASPRRRARDARETPSLPRTPARAGIIIIFSLVAIE